MHSPSDIRITPQRLEILRVCHDYKRVTSEHVIQLVPGNSRVIYRQLKKLSEAGYITKKDVPIRYHNWHRTNRSSLINQNMFSIGDHGLAALAVLDGVYAGKKRPSTVVKKTTKDFDTHELLLTDFLIEKRSECEASGHKKMLYPYPDKVLSALPERTRLKYRTTHSQNAFGWKVKTKWTGKPITLPYFPDFFLPIEDTATGKISYYLIEIDTGTETIIPESYGAYNTMMNNRSILRKMVAIHESWIQHIPKEHLGVKGFQVLFVPTTHKRIGLFKEASELMLKVTKPERKGRNLLIYRSRRQKMLVSRSS